MKGIASAGNADPGKEGFREDSQVGGAGSNTPSLILTDGRADSMCCAQAAARGSSYAACSHTQQQLRQVNSHIVSHACLFTAAVASGAAHANTAG